MITYLSIYFPHIFSSTCRRHSAPASVATPHTYFTSSRAICFYFFCSSLRRASLFSFSVCLFRNRDYDRRIYHLVSSAEIKVSWEQLIDCGRWIICNRLPLNGVLWYPGGSMKSSRLHHNICCILYHWIPAIILDCLLFCLRYPPV